MGLAFLITSDNLQILSERKVLKEAEYSALLEASSVIDAARTEAARMARQAGQL
jgi:type III secretion protein L